MQRAATKAILSSVAMLVMGVQEATGLSITITRVPGHFSGSGGEFNITPVAGDPLLNVISQYGANAVVNGGFESFCVERNEYISPPETVRYVLGNSAVNGGVGGGNPDPISVGTAFLYAQFATGILSGYDYDPLGGRSGSAGLLQEAIWCLEDETTCGTNGFLAMVSNRFGGLANAKANNNGLYGVGVLNNTNDNGFRQDMLVLRPVPEPGSMLLLGSGLLGYPLLRRKQRKRS